MVSHVPDPIDTSLFKEGTMTLMKAHEGLKFSCLVTEQKENRFACVSWKDKGSQPTNFYSNIHSNEVTKVLRSFKGRKRLEIIPKVAHDNTVNGMGHVDAYKMNMVNQKPTHRNASWRRCCFYALLKMVFINSWIYCKHVCAKTDRELPVAYTQQDFLCQLRDELSEDYSRFKRDEVKLPEEKSKRKNRE